VKANAEVQSSNPRSGLTRLTRGRVALAQGGLARAALGSDFILITLNCHNPSPGVFNCRIHLAVKKF
jgi:hypothetical protein